MKYNRGAISYTNSSCAITLITGGKVPAIFTQVKVTKLGADICTYISMRAKIPLKSTSGLINIVVQRKKRSFNF